MTYRRTIATIVAAWVMAQILAVLVHGFILGADYAPFYGTLLRSFATGPGWPAVFLPVAHLSYVCALVWLYPRIELGRSQVIRGAQLGVIGWLTGQVPLFLTWYAEQPWPSDLVVKQLTLTLLSAMIIGMTIAAVAGSRSSNNRVVKGDALGP